MTITKGNDASKRSPLSLRSFYTGLAIALALHFLLISLPIAFAIDINLFKAWSIQLVQQGLGNFYDYSNCDYPPAYLYILWLVGKLYQLFDPSFAHSDNLLLTAMLKLLPALANIGAATLIAKILKPHTTEHQAYAIALIYAFNPLTMFVSAVWGQVDAVVTFLMLWAFDLIQKNHLIRSGLLVATLVIMKPQGLFITPFLFLSQWFLQPWWKWGAIAFGGTFLVWLIILPFYGVEQIQGVIIEGININFLIVPFASLYQRLQSTANYYDFASVNAFNLWGWANWVRDSTTFAGISYKVIGLSLLGIMVMWLGFFLYQQRHQANFFAANCLAISTLLVGCFILPTRMHERYMIYSLAFMAIAIGVIPLFKWIYGSFTITGAINVGYVYFRYNHENWYSTIPSAWLQNLIYVVSACNITLFVILLWQTFRIQAVSLQIQPSEIAS